jgi:hypothetical protein
VRKSPGWLARIERSRARIEQMQRMVTAIGDTATDLWALLDHPRRNGEVMR